MARRTFDVCPLGKLYLTSISDLRLSKFLRNLIGGPARSSCCLAPIPMKTARKLSSFSAASSLAFVTALASRLADPAEPLCHQPLVCWGKLFTSLH